MFPDDFFMSKKRVICDIILKIRGRIVYEKKNF